MTRRHPLAGLVGLVMAAGAAHADTGAAWQAEVGAGRDSLSGGRPAWTQVDAAVRGPLGPQHRLQLDARRTERFGARDTEAGARLDWRAAPGWSTALALTASGTHQVLARRSVQGELSRQLEGGWVASALVRHSLYRNAEVAMLGAGVERYLAAAGGGDWRGAAQLSATRLAGGGSGGGLRLQLDRSWAGGARLGLIVAGGREAESPAAGQWVVRGVRAVALAGQWPLAPGWALTGDVSTTRVDDLYHRSGARLGVRRDF